MSIPLRDYKVGIERLARYEERIDVRSPAEFAGDHIPGAISAPVLSDAERVRIGTLHAQSGEFSAKRAGSAIVARNIAAMLEGPFIDKPRDWAPLVYCWRGGKRSESLTHVLNEIGWRAVRLDGGYRAYRRHVIAQLARLPSQFRFHVICGLTGSGKSRLLGTLAAEGAQTLDLEALAKHRGSLLGDLPDDPQPSQRHFETLLHAALSGFDPDVPVYVESESRRIGSVQLPDALLDTMRHADCVRIDTPQPLRIELLKHEYAHLMTQPGELSSRLTRLVPLHSRHTIERWEEAARAGDWELVIGELLAQHYDPMYTRSIERNFPNVASAIVISPPTIDEHGFRAVARELETEVRARHGVATPVV